MLLQVSSSIIEIPVTAELNIFSELVGYGGAVTGGKNGTVVTVTNTNDTGAGSLRQAIIDASGATWIVFTPDLTGVITLNTALGVKANLTIDGRGADITLDNDKIQASNAESNMIFLYLKHTGNSGAGDDCFQMDQDPNEGQFWIHHCTLADAQDECIGVTNDVTDFTISYCKIDNNTGSSDAQTKGLLLGGSDGATVDMKCTIHHCRIDAFQRLPRTRNVQLHMYNCYMSGWDVDPAVAIGDNGQCYFEKNIGDDTGTQNTVYSWKASDPNPGDTKSVGPHLLLGTTDLFEHSPELVFDPNDDYTYTAETADTTLQAKLNAEPGWQDVDHPGTSAPWDN